MNKQIEEMYKDIYEAINHNAVIDVIHGGYIGVNTEGLTRELYDDGYRKQSEWISVNCGLPNEDGWYITYTNANGKSNGVITQHLVTATIRGKKIRRWEWNARVSPWVVTHWMPLPMPPKGDEGK